MTVGLKNADATPAGSTGSLFMSRVVLLLSGGLAGATGVAMSDHVAGDWKLVLIVLGALALGFGGAVLSFKILVGTRTSDLEAEYEKLGLRARALVTRAELFERQQDAEREAPLR